MPEVLFDEWVAQRYESLWPELFDPAMVDPAVDFLAELAGPGPALELGVGTGRIALPLSRRGVRVHGIELSPAMVAQLRAQPGASDIDVTVGDFTTAKANGTFTLAYLVRNTITNLTTQDEQVECFRNVAAHLEPGGCFVVENYIPELQRLPPGETVRVFTATPSHVGFEEYNVSTQIAFSHHYWMIDGHLATFSSPHRYVWPSEMDLMARLAGMTLRERWSDWHREPFTSESRNYVSVWEKAREPDAGTETARSAAWHAEFRDPRLVEVYDAECPWSRDDDFFLSTVNGRTGARVLDLGSGTGRLSLALADAGHAVSGVDPAWASLDAARGKPGADRVTWIEGTSSVLPSAAFDVAIMTSHVVQFFLSDHEWERTLADLKRTLVPGGTLAFDTRDPEAREWERWNRVDSRRKITMADGRVVTAWTEVTSVDNSVVSFTHHYDFPDGEQLRSTASLRFRSEAEVRSSLHAADFSIEQMYGGWHREPVGTGDGELLVIARA